MALRIAALASIVIALIVAACGGGDATPTPLATATAEPENRVVTSDDGKLTLEIPPGAVDDEVEITATKVPLDQLPAALQELSGAGDGYLLEPDGLTFSEPVLVSLRLEGEDIEVFVDEGGVSMAALVSLTTAGERTLLGGLETQYALDEGTLVARGELTHFSWLSRTKGTLRAALEEVTRQQPVGGSFTAYGTAEYVRPQFVTNEKPVLEDVTGTFSASGTVAASGTTSLGGAGAFLETPGTTWSARGTFGCGQAGLGSYLVRVTATSVVVVDGKRLTTPLRIVVNSLIDCVLATATPEPAVTPAAGTLVLATATPEPAVTPAAGTLVLSCDHRIPGEETDIIVRVEGLEPGQTVIGLVTGPGVIGDGSFSATADSSFVAEASVPINKFGEYDVKVDGLSGTIEVGAVCPPPDS